VTPVLSAADAAAPERAAEALRKPGAVILVPTETVYGLVCRAADAVAAERIYELKHRDGGKRLGVFVPDETSLSQLDVTLSELGKRLFDQFCPGPLTLIVPTRSGSTLGFRCPDHPFLARLLRACAEPLLQTSANRSGMPDARSPKEALDQLTGEVDLAVDAGLLAPDACASTVADCTGKTVKILRQGSLVLPLD